MNNNRITTPFGAQSTAADVIAGIDLSGRRVIVTGGASGIGVETARALAGANAEVTLAVRNLEAGERTAEDIIASMGNKQVLVAPLDLVDQASVAAFVANWDGPLHILVNNAGIMAAAAGGARVVVVSSRGHLNGEVLFDDINFERHPYDPWAAYSQSKTANILFTVEAAKRWAAAGISVNALTPGRIRTNLMRFIGDETTANAPASFEATSPEIVWKTVEQGAATSVLLAVSPLLEGVTGRYFEDCNEAELRQPGILRDVAEYAIDPEKAARLWQVSIDMLAGSRGCVPSADRPAVERSSEAEGRP